MMSQFLITNNIQVWEAIRAPVKSHTNTARTGIYTKKKIPRWETWNVWLTSVPFPVHEHRGVSLRDAIIQS